MTRKLLSIFMLCFALINTTQADDRRYDVTLTYPLAIKDPNPFHGYRAAAGYQPQCFIWGKGQLYFDLSYGHWWTDNMDGNSSISIYSLAPIFRYYLVKKTISPFLEASIGVAYMNKTRIGPRNLGEHFTFQDQLGAGIAFGAEQQLAISLSALHYSNGSLSEHNSGITVPLIINVNYRF